MTPARVLMKKPATVRNQSCHCAPCHEHEKKACYGCQTCWNSSTSTHYSMEGGDKPGDWVRAVSVTAPSFPLLDMRTFHVSPAPSCPSGSRRVMEFSNDGKRPARRGRSRHAPLLCANRRAPAAGAASGHIGLFGVKRFGKSNNNISSDSLKILHHCILPSRRTIPNK